MSGVLLIGTANDRRSAMADLLLRHRLTERSFEVPVVSAGFDADTGAPLHPSARAALRTLAVPADRFAAQALLPDMIAQADLVLTASRAHREDVVTLEPDAVRRTFTIRELALLLEGLVPADVPGAAWRTRLRAISELAARRRQLTAVPPAGLLDVPVLAGRRKAAHVEVAHVVDRAIAVLADVLATPAPPRTPTFIDLTTAEHYDEAAWHIARSAGR